MAAEDVIELQTVGYAKLASAAGVVVALDKGGAVSAIAGGPGTFTLTLNTGDGVPNTELIVKLLPTGGATGAGGMASISLNQPASTDTSKRFEVYGDDRTTPITTWQLSVLLQRIVNQR